MKVILIALFLVVCTCKSMAQNDFMENKVSTFESITQLLKSLETKGSINNIKHVNQKVGYKDGLWLETDRFEIWFLNYVNGIKEGKFYCYDITTGKKHAEGTYKKDVLIDSLSIYDANGTIHTKYKSIQKKENKLKLVVEMANDENDGFKLVEQEVTFVYETEFEKYTSEGEIYKTGIGVFNDAKSYEIKENRAISQDLNLFRIYELKD